MWEYAFRYAVLIPVAVRLALMVYYRSNTATPVGAGAAYNLRRRWQLGRSDVILFTNLWAGLACVFCAFSFIASPAHAPF